MDPDVARRFQVIFDRVIVGVTDEFQQHLDKEQLPGETELSVLRAEIQMDIDYVMAEIRDKDKDKDKDIDYKYERAQPICWSDLYYAFKKVPSLFTAAEWSDMLAVVESFKYDETGYSLY